MKKIIFIAIAAVALVATSCTNLDTQDLTHKNTTNYPQTYADAQSVLAGMYSVLNSGNYSPTFLMASELASDDQLGGGGANDYSTQAQDLLMSSGTDMFRPFWQDCYAGIHRANNAIETLDNCSGYPSDDQKNQMMGEAYFMRAFYYYELASTFENIPLVLTTDPVNNPQATPDDTWGQIISDLKQAITLMPSHPVGWQDAGHADRWTAEALMARCWLFYTGFYQKDAATLPDGSTVAKSDVSGWIDDCVNNSGYSLVPDFRELWAYTNRCTVEDYPYTAGQGLVWAENDNAINPESMFAIKFNKFASYNGGSTPGFSNWYAVGLGMRLGMYHEDQIFPFGGGWGWGPVAPNLWDDWVKAEPNDMRRAASICDIPSELPNYQYSCGGSDTYIQETEYSEKKQMPIQAKNADGSLASTFEQIMYSYNAANQFQLGTIHDLILIRFADVLLMQSELEQNVTGINKVRARAGLPPIAGYSDAALQNERRWELAFEFVRWNDIRRWHIAETALAEQDGQPVYTNGVVSKNTTASNGGGYAARYKATNGGFFPIPESEIALSNGVLKQNAGWDGSSLYTGWR